MKRKLRQNFAPLIYLSLFSAFLLACGGTSESSGQPVSVTSESEENEPNPWILYTDSEAFFSIKFPEYPTTKTDTTEQFFVHISAYETENSFYKVSAFVQKKVKDVGESMDYVYAMKNSLNNNYTIFHEEEQIINTRTGLHIDALRNDWAISRFMVAENGVLYILDIAAYGDEVPSSLAAEGFWKGFEILSVN